VQQCNLAINILQVIQAIQLWQEKLNGELWNEYLAIRKTLKYLE
jgi:uncharacterized membrane protein (DUF2068 family)